VERSKNEELERGTIKYLVQARLEVNGVVEPSDVVGAIFGQTEGLLGEELEMRELLRTGKIGRIKVNLSSSQGKTIGTVLLPSGLDKMETCLLAAALETVDRIGPCEAKITVEKIEDVRASKREIVLKRAKELMREVESPETQELFRSLRESLHQAKIVEYAGLPAGPKVATSDSIIIVEGRADVLNLLRAGIENVIATEGASVSSRNNRPDQKENYNSFRGQRQRWGFDFKGASAGSRSRLHCKTTAWKKCGRTYCEGDFTGHSETGCLLVCTCERMSRRPSENFVKCQLN